MQDSAQARAFDSKKGYGCHIQCLPIGIHDQDASPTCAKKQSDLRINDMHQRKDLDKSI